MYEYKHQMMVEVLVQIWLNVPRTVYMDSCWDSQLDSCGASGMPRERGRDSWFCFRMAPSYLSDLTVMITDPQSVGPGLNQTPSDF